MAVGRLEITTYATVSGPYQTEVILHPSWEVIESAIVRLDRCYHPFVWLYARADAPEGDPADFEVVGGRGAWAVVCRAGGAELWLSNPSAGDDEIEVWESDQGTSIAERLVCTLLGEVLLAARHFAEHGTPNPDSVWGTSEPGR
jgi:hypothetical protein